MLFKLFDEGDPGGKPASADDKPDEGKKESKDQKPESLEDKPEVKPEDKPKDDGKDYKALHEASEAKLKEFESGVSPKLMKLAEYEKAEEAKKPKEDDDLAKVDEQITATDKEIAIYAQQRLDTTSLKGSKMALELQRKRIIEDKHAQAVSAQVATFRKEHKDLKNNDFDALTDIMQDAENKGQSMGLYAAYEIYSRDLAIAKAKESANIDDETRDLSKKALGQDGKPLPDKGGGEKQTATQKFYEEQFGKENADRILKMEKK